MDTEKTKVIFRKFSDGEIIALFPEIFQGYNLCLSYMHIGQHGAASYDLVYDTKLASENEYKPLLEELQSIGYNLIICKRISPQMRENAYKEGKQIYYRQLPEVC